MGMHSHGWIQLSFIPLTAHRIQRLLSIYARGLWKFEVWCLNLSFSAGVGSWTQIGTEIAVKIVGYDQSNTSRIDGFLKGIVS